MAKQRRAVTQKTGRPEFSFEVAQHPTEPKAQVLLRRFTKTEIVPMGKIVDSVEGNHKALFDQLSKTHKLLGCDVKRGNGWTYVIKPFNAKQKQIVAEALRKMAK